MTRRLLITVIATLLTATTALADTFIYVSVAAEKRIAVFRLNADTGKLTHRSDPLDGQIGFVPHRSLPSPCMTTGSCR
jgi:hypothetical protein